MKQVYAMFQSFFSESIVALLPDLKVTFIKSLLESKIGVQEESSSSLSEDSSFTRTLIIFSMYCVKNTLLKN
jgi:hypothetical protein